MEIIGREDLFARLCRVISLTEKRGHRQVEILLRHPIVRRDPMLMKIFRIIEQDEPSHWAPYEDWLHLHGRREPSWWERVVDHAIHSELLFIKLPILFLSLSTKRISCWPDEEDTEALAAQDVEALAA